MKSANRVSATSRTVSVVTVVAPAAFRRSAVLWRPTVSRRRYHDPMSELPAGETHDVIHHDGEVVAVVVPIAEYQQLRQALAEQRVNEEFDAVRAGYQTRRKAGVIRYVSHEEAGRRLGLPSG